MDVPNMENETTSLLMSSLEENTEDKYRLPSLAEVPWLIATHDNQKPKKLEKQTFRTNTNSFWKTIPELHRNIIVAAHQGWLILRDRENYSNYSLWNPVTSQFLRLPELLLAPELEEDNEIMPFTCLLTESLDLNNNPETCKLVLFFKEGLTFSCTPSCNCSWVKQRLELDGTSKVEIDNACVLEGVIYGYAFGSIDNSCKGVTEFVRINFAQDSSNSITLNPMIIDHPEAEIKFKSCRVNRYMVESCGVLYYIRLMLTAEDDDMGNLDIIKVWVWRLDFLQMQWIKVTSLRNRAFLLGSHCCTWCWASTRSSSGGFIEENCLYFSIKGSQKVYSYDLQDDSSTILLPYSNSIQNFYGPTWFMPENHKRLFPEEEGNQMISEETKQIQNLNQEFQEQMGDIQEASSGTLLSELPLDVLQTIGKCVNLFDYMNLRATCKSLHAGNPLAQWRANSRYPLFIVRTDNSGIYELFDPFENVSRTILTFKKYSEVSLEYCKDGWLLLRSEVDTLEYVNPSTRETRTYPPCEMDCATFGFSTCSTSPDCLIVGISGWGNVEISCFDSAHEEWEYFDMDFNSDEDIPFYANHKTSPVYHKDAFYFHGMNSYPCLGELQFLEEEISWHVYKSPFPDGTKLNSSYLVELDGELVSVFIGEDGNWVKVFKFDTLDKCWMRLDTLGQHVLFVSSVSSFSIKSEKNVMKNRIYLPLRKDNEVVFYSLDTGKYHTSGSANSMDNFYGMKVQSSCCWI